MEAPEENGRSFPVDLNENEEEGAGRKSDVRGVVGHEAGNGLSYVTGNGRNVNTDGASEQPAPPLTPYHGKGVVLLDRLTDRGVMSEVCGGHRGLNGFTESPDEEERIMVGLHRGGGREGGGGGGLAGTAAVSCPAVLGDQVSAGTELQTGPHRTGETPDSDDVLPGEDVRGGGSVTDHIRTPPSLSLSPLLGQLSCTANHRRNNCTSCTAAFPVSDGKMPNGDVDSPVYGGRDVDAACCKPTAAASGQTLGFCDVDREEVKVANGGFYILNTTGATRDRHETDYLTDNNKDLHVEPGSGSGLCARSQSDHSGGLASGCTGEDAPSAAALPRCFLLPPSGLDKEGSSPPNSGSSAKLPSSPCPSTSSDLTGDTLPGTGEDPAVGFGDLSSPARPQTLRTNPNIAFSLSCDATPLSPEEDEGFYFGEEGYEEEEEEGDFRNNVELGRRQSAPDKLPDQSSDSFDTKLMPRRFGISDFFTRSLFTRKSKDPKAPSHNAAGWRLFGKAATRENVATQDPPSSTQQEEQLSGSEASWCPHRPPAAGRRRNLEFEPLSTTALILEDRPANLPAKSLEETHRHRLEYDEMVAGAKRRELKEAQKKKRQMKERHRQEESISHAMVVWNNDILPHWDAVKGTRRVRELWWQGLPPSVRGRVWSLAIGNELNITPELYEIFLSRAKEKWRSYSETSSVNDSESDCGASLADRESSLDLIKLDISRTFPSLFIFQKGGPYHDLLHSVLGAYTCYRPDIGYVQGMSFIAAVLILNLEEADAFITFANLLNKPCQMAFFRVDHELMLKYFAAFEMFFEENLPRLFSHFQTNSLTPDLYLIDWIFTLYSKSLPLDVACRVWDVFCRDGEESLFRTGLGILRLYEDVLLQMDFIHIAQFLTRLPEDLPAHTLFTAMANTHMVSRTGRWAQVFSALMKDGNKETDKNNSPALRS
ncbi:TBC1 domain family member 12 [Diretmus argenteus]